MVIATLLAGTLPYRGKVVLNIPRKFAEKVVALTFDDGPSSVTTPIVLDALKNAGAHATFFLMGERIHGNEALLRRMVNEGHEIGNHTWSHQSKPKEDIAGAEVDKTTAAIKAVIGTSPLLFRPPYGIVQNATTRVARSQGFPLILWTGSAADTATSVPDKVRKNVVMYAKPGAIILMHDVKAHTAKAVPEILRQIKTKGLKFTTVSEMLRKWDAQKNK